MTDEILTARIGELKAEIDAISGEFNSKKTEVATVNEQWQDWATKAQRRVTHLEGCIAEANRIKAELFPAQPAAETPPT